MTITQDIAPQFNSEVPPPRMPLTAEERESERLRIYQEVGIDVMAEYPGVFDLEIINAVRFPHPSLENAFQSGCAEPWTSQLLASLLIASNARTVLETGGFTGQTSAWLAMALERLGGGELTVVDIDGGRCQMIADRLDGLGLKAATARVVESDILLYIPQIPDRSLGFVWVDDDHAYHHVESEINALWDKMAPGGLMLFHDVWGVCDLQRLVKKYGGLSIDLPRLGPAGGVGLIQIPR